jgi:glucose/arabinose dehydrogenase
MNTNLPISGLAPDRLEVSMKRFRLRGRLAATAAVVAALVVALSRSMHADTVPLAMNDPNLQATVVINAGITQPIGIVFLGPNDFLVLEKASGQVKRVINGVIQANVVLDLAVNSNSERGLLSMVLAPNFPTDPSVYIRWTESSTGADSAVVTDVPLLGNRVDRFVWNPAGNGKRDQAAVAPAGQSECPRPRDLREERESSG